MAILDKNTILSLTKDPKSIDVHNMTVANMKRPKINPNSKHDFIEDRARTKGVKNMDELFSKINKLRKNGTLDMWMKKYGQQHYGPNFFKESTDLFGDVLEDSNSPSGYSIKINKNILTENFTAGPSAAPIAPMVSSNIKIEDKYPINKSKEEGETDGELSSKNKQVSNG